STGRRADWELSPSRSLPDSLRRCASQLTEIVGGLGYGAGMAKSSASGYRCTECGWQSAKWAGRCGECQAWGTVQEVVGAPRLARASREAVRAAVQRGTLTASGVTAGGAPASAVV